MDQNKPRPNHSEEKLFVASGFYLLAAMGLVLLSLGMEPLSRLLFRLFPGLTQEWATLAVNLIYYVPFVLLPVTLWAATRKDGDPLRLNPISPGATIRIVLVALLCVSGVYSLTMLWTALWQRLGLDVFNTVYIRPANTGELTRSVLSAAVVAGVSEELLFRGVMLSAWEQRGEKHAFRVTAVLFALLHGSLLGFPGELICGLLMASLVHWTNSIYAGMIFHSTYNAALVMLNYISSGMEGAAATGDLFTMMGGLSGALSLIFRIALMAALVWSLLQKLQIAHLLEAHSLKQINEALVARKRANAEGGTLWEHATELRDELTRLNQPKARPAPLSAGLILVIAAGILGAAVLYAFDLISML